MSEPAESVKKQLQRVLHRAATEVPPSTAVEPCVGCGEETVVGSVLYSDRHDLVGDDGKKYLCAECYQRARALKGGEALSEADQRVIANNGLMVAANILSPGGM